MKSNLNVALQKGISGLSNLGNTCYINSCIQILSHTTELNELLDDTTTIKRINKKIIDGVLLEEWNSLRNLMWSSNCVISPGRFFKMIQLTAKDKNMELFTGYSQNDINEFFMFILDSFHNALSRSIKITISGKIENNTDKLALSCYETIQNNYKLGYSEICELFNGISVSIISDFHSNQQLNYKCETFFTLDLPIPKNRSPTLKDCFDLYTEEEEIVGDNAWFDENQNKKIDIKKKLLFWSFPKILVITLKRFTNVDKKIQKLVTFPLDELDLSDYVVGYNKEKYNYELYGVCNHHGTFVGGGHYTSFIKANNESSKAKWYEFNDASITAHSSDKKIVSTKAYCLFYRRKIT